MPIFASRPFTIIPAGANGESDPELAPLATIIVIKKAEIFARLATRIAIGPMIAAMAILPGPIEARIEARKKNMMGISPTFPRQPRTA